MKNMIFFIPARSGSKGIKNKNLLQINGKSLVERAILFCKKININKTIILSSDSNEILEIGSKHGVFCHKRKKSLSRSKSKISDVIYNLINEEKQLFNIQKDWLTIVEPTSPFRNKKTFNKMNNLILTGKFNSIITLFETHDVFWSFSKKEKKCDRLFKIKSSNRQEREPLFKESNSFFLFKISKFMKTKEIFSSPVGAVICDKKESIDINDINDYNYAKSLELQ